jgi:hypothetical protein
MFTNILNLLHTTDDILQLLICLNDYQSDDCLVSIKPDAMFNLTIHSTQVHKTVLST